jgi:cell division protein FtsB
MRLKFNPKRIIVSLAVIIVLVVVFTHKNSVNFFKNIIELKRLEKIDREVDKEYADLQKEKQMILGDKDYLETLARTKLNMAKPGEVEFRFTPPAKEK